MCEQPLISVIIPVYNVERYLSRCIESIVNQSYQKLEILLIDDGSTDESRSICLDYANKDRRIKVLVKENGGLSSARNAGLREVRGDFVTFVDSDDWIHSKMIELLYSLIQKTDAEVSFCGSIKVKENSCVDEPLKKNDCKIFSKKEILELFFKRRYTACWSRLFKTEMLKNISFPEGLNCEDFIFMYLALRRCNYVAVSDLPLYYYFIRPGSITNSAFSIKSMDQFYSAKKMVELVELNDCEYKALAQIRVIEALSLLLDKTRKNKMFCAQYKELKEYAVNHVKDIAFNQSVYWKIRVNVIKHLIPFF